MITIAKAMLASFGEWLAVRAVKMKRNRLSRWLFNLGYWLSILA